MCRSSSPSGDLATVWGERDQKALRLRLRLVCLREPQQRQQRMSTMTSTIVTMIYRNHILSAMRTEGGNMIRTIVITPTIVIITPAIAEITASMAPPIAEKMEPWKAKSEDAVR
jgi:ABC-type antimicrobial peptide transport system ATPase subunit